MAANPQPAAPDRLSTEELARLYFDEGLSLAKVGNKVGLPPTTVHYRLKCAGYKLRPRSVPTIPTAKLIRLYEGGLSCAKVGKQVGLSSRSVYSRLKLAGCKMRPRKENTVGVPTEELRRLYFDERLKLLEVGAIVGLNFASVSSRLRRAGYTLRTSAPPKKEVPSIASLIDDYVNRQISVATLAERTGLKPSLIWSRLRDAGVVRPRGHNAKEIWAKRNKQLAEGKRPADWWAKPLDWRIIGNELLSQPYMSNTDLGARLDVGRIIKCPYGPKDSLWEDVLSSDKKKKVKAAIKFVGEIRDWVGRPGRNPANSGAVNLSVHS